MVEIEEDEDVRVIATSGLRLVFRWTGDRWTHALEVTDLAGWATFGESVEASAYRDDPGNIASPTYQELHIQREGEHVLALLVGRFGPRHFSGVFRVRHELDKNENSWTFVEVDVADRSHDAPESFTSTYLIDGPVGALLLGADPEGVAWEPRHHFNFGIYLRVSPNSESREQIRLDEVDGGWRACVSSRINTAEKTHRLRYEWCHTHLSKRFWEENPPPP